MDEPRDQPEEIVDAETIEVLPAVAEVRVVEPARPVSLPGIQAAAMTATGFFAGALAMAVVKRLAARKLSEATPVARLPEHWPAGTTRTYLVNVRLISRPSE